MKAVKCLTVPLCNESILFVQSVESVGQTSAAVTNSPSRMQVEDIKPNIAPSPQPNEAMKPPSSIANASHSAVSTSVRHPFKKHFLPEELRRNLMPTLEKLYQMHPEGLPFRNPVDPKSLGCMVRNFILFFD